MADSSKGISRPANRLDSWKEIAAYVKRDITTVQRWEKREGMPVHRHVHDQKGSVYAYSSELDEWLESRRLRFKEESDEKSPTEGAAERSPERRRGGQVSRWLFLGAMAAIVVISVGYVFRARRRVPMTQKITSIAVLPLANLSGDPAQEYLADGMTEAVIGRLSMIRGLRVISRTSVMQFKERRMSIPEIAQVLHVDAIVEGSAIREGTRVRVHAQLIRGATDEHFWSQTYDRNFGDALELESQVAQSIAEKVEVTLTGEEHARLVASRVVSPDVYESYLKGEFALTRGPADLGKAEAYFEDAIKKDENFAPAYVGLAAVDSELGTVFVGVRPADVRSKEINAARKAVELDPTLSKARALLGKAYEEEWQWRESEAEYKHALDLNPNDADAHSGYGDWLACQGRTDESQQWVRRARELDPVGIGGAHIGWTLFVSRHYEEAIRELRSALAVNPDDAVTNWYLGFALSGNGENEEAIQVLKKALSLSNGSPGVMGVLVRAYARAGHRAEALQVLEELKERQKRGYVPAGAFVNAYLGLGDTDQVFAWCERAYEEKSNVLRYIKVNPFFDPVRDDPRFSVLLRRIGLAVPLPRP